MNLSNDLVNKFVEITNDETPNKEGSTAYGVTVQYGDRMYVKLDGSDLLTPVETTSAIKSGERVTVLIKDHNATVTGNLSDPSASSKDLTDVGDKIAEVDILIADKVDTKILVAETARIEELIATKASIGQLEADRAEIEHLIANKAEITDLEAINADIEILDAEVADIETLVNGHLTSDNIQSLVLTSDKVTVDDAFIKDAMIANVSANKITSGQINTSLVSISSEDGSMTLNGSTQQFKDSEGTVRIQIGKDAEGNFTFCLFSQDGVGILLDEEGIHAGAVPDGLIVNDMVADNANISGGKLDINSVITSINNGTTTIDSSRIYLDEESQSLKIAFDSLKTKVETIEEISINGDLSSVIEQITSNTTNISVMQGQISSLISNTTITKENGEVVQLKDEYNSTKNTVDSHATKIGSLTTAVNDVSSKQASMELDLSGFKTTVSNTYATTTQLNTTNSNVTTAQNTADSALSKANTNANNITTISSKQSSMELDLDGFRTEVSNSYATKGELEGLKSSANFIKNGKFEGAIANSSNMPAEWTGWGCSKRIYSTPYLEDGVVRIEIREEGEDGGIYQDVNGLPKNTTFTLSFKYHVQRNIQNPYCDITFYDNNGNRVSNDLVYDLDVAGAGDDTAKWKVITFTTPNVDFRNITIGFGTLGGLSVNNGSLFNFSVGLVQLELGTTQTPWKDNESIYVTKTEFNQTNEDFTFKIQQSGGYNLLKNSNFTNGTAYWTKLCWDGTHTLTSNLHVMEAYRTWNNNHFAGLEYLADISQPQGFVRGGFDSSYIYNLEPGAKYSFSCYASCGRIDELVVELCGTDWDSQYVNWGVLWRGPIGANTREGINYEGWTKIEVTFTAPNAYCMWIRFWGNKHTEGSQSVSLMISQPCLVRGSIPLDWSPHSSEIYDGIVKIDSRGLSVQHGNNSTVMDSDSFQIKVGSDTHARIKNGQFSFTDATGSITLGRVGRSYWEGTTVAMTSLGASYGNTIALSAQRESNGTYITGALCSSKEQWLGDSYYYQGLDISNPIVTGRMRFRDVYSNRMASFDGISIGMLDLWALDDSSWGGYGGMVIGNNYLRLGTYSGSVARAGIIVREDNNQSNGTAVHGYGPLNMHGYDISNAGWINPVSASSEYTYRLLRQGTNEHINYGTLSYYEGELRWCWKENVFTYQDCDIDPVTDEWVYFDRYICYVELPIFMAENIEADYHINVSKMSWGDWRIREKNQYYFILESQEEDFAFTFEVVAKLKDGATITNNAIVANNSIDTVASTSVPQDIEGVVDPVDSINSQENINTEEGEE